MASLFLRSRGSFSQIDSEDSPPNFYKLALLFYKVPFTSFDGEMGPLGGAQCFPLISSMQCLIQSR